MEPLADAIDELARSSGFSGVVRGDRSGETVLAVAYGRADRAHGIANTVGTRFATGRARWTSGPCLSLTSQAAGQWVGAGRRAV